MKPALFEYLIQSVREAGEEKRAMERREREGRDVLTEGHIADCKWFYAELDRLKQNMEAEFAEMEQFITGRRRSPYPLGKKFLLNRGHELEQLQRELEWRLKGNS